MLIRVTSRHYSNVIRVEHVIRVRLHLGLRARAHVHKKSINSDLKTIVAMVTQRYLEGFRTSSEGWPKISQSSLMRWNLNEMQNSSNQSDANFFFFGGGGGGDEPIRLLLIGAFSNILFRYSI